MHYTNKYYHFLKLGYDTVTNLDSMTLKHDESSRGIIVIMVLWLHFIIMILDESTDIDAPKDNKCEDLRKYEEGIQIIDFVLPYNYSI